MHEPSRLLKNREHIPDIITLHSTTPHTLPCVIMGQGIRCDRCDHVAAAVHSALQHALETSPSPLLSLCTPYLARREVGYGLGDLCADTDVLHADRRWQRLTLSEQE